MALLTTTSITGTGTTGVIGVNNYAVPVNLTVAMIAPTGGAISGTFQHTLDNVFSATYSATTGNWFQHATLSGPGSQTGNYSFPIMGIRGYVSSASGGQITVFQVIQAGIGQGN